MIISASYRTDLPAFYGEWFLNRLAAGYCMVRNPYGGKPYRVDLRRETVDGFVFWTKNITPFMKVLGQVREAGYPFVVQHSITGYPRELESAVVDPARSVENLHRIAEAYGPRVCVWRYDTIIHSSLTPGAWHVANFERLARELRGVVDEVVISFACIYRKTLRNMRRADEEYGLEWSDPSPEEKRQLAGRLAEIAGDCKMQLSVCSQRDLVVPGAAEARCIDAGRMSDVAGVSIVAKVKGNRAECACHESRDIGAYDTCPHGCVYCYAVNDPVAAREKFRGHDPEGQEM